VIFSVYCAIVASSRRNTTDLIMLATLSDILSVEVCGPLVVMSERSTAVRCATMTVCLGSSHCFLTRCCNPSSVFLIIPGKLSTLFLSCCKEVDAIEVFRKGSQPASFPFSPLDVAAVSFSMVFFLLFHFVISGGSVVLFYVRWCQVQKMCQCTLNCSFTQS